jgi:hypothetical protein
MKLREMYKDHGRFKKQAKELQAWILENFTEQQQYKKFIDIIMSTVETTSDDEVNLLFDQLMAQ